MVQSIRKRRKRANNSVTELLGGFEWAGSLFKVLLILLIIAQLARKRRMSPRLEHVRAGIVLALLATWTVEGYLTGLITIYGATFFPHLILYTIISRGVLYLLVLAWCLLYIVLVPTDHPDLEELDKLE